jgi:hypothetical protein
MSQYSSNQNNNNNNNNNGSGSVIGTIVVIIAFLSVLGNVGKAASSSAAIKAASNNITVTDKEQDRTAMVYRQLEKQRQERLNQLKLLEPLEYHPIKLPDLSKIELKLAEHDVMPELFAEKVVARKQFTLPEEPQIVFNDDFSEYKPLSDIRTRIRMLYSNGDKNIIVNSVPEISDSIQDIEPDFSSVNIVEENIGYNSDILSIELGKYEVTPQALIHDFSKSLNKPIHDKIPAW